MKLQQAQRQDDPQDGAAARFADVRMVLFANEDAARAYVAAYARSLAGPRSSVRPAVGDVGR